MTFRDCIAFAPQDAILLGVVDPGVGTDRKAVAVETASQRVLVGPTTGCSPWRGTRRADPPGRSRSPLPTGATAGLEVFHGRDVFAPAAAHLAAGLPPEKLGPQIDIGELVSLRLPEADVLTGEVRAQVLDADRFGNVRLNVRPSDLPTAEVDGSRVKVATTDTSAIAERVSTYAEVAPGAFAVIEDAWWWTGDPLRRERRRGARRASGLPGLAARTRRLKRGPTPTTFRSFAPSNTNKGRACPVQQRQVALRTVDRVRGRPGPSRRGTHRSCVMT